MTGRLGQLQAGKSKHMQLISWCRQVMGKYQQAMGKYKQAMGKYRQAMGKSGKSWS